VAVDYYEYFSTNFFIYLWRGKWRIRFVYHQRVILGGVMLYFVRETHDRGSPIHHRKRKKIKKKEKKEIREILIE
jgi:hypothetical protein